MTDPIARNSILTRVSFQRDNSLSSVQSQVDNLVTHTVEEAANPQTLAALSVGGAAYRLGRMGILGLGVNATGNTATVVRGLSFLGGLGTEVGAFELTNRSLSSLSGSQNPNLWHWSGQGGWAQGLSSSAITFGMLKSAGFAAREQNLVLQHAFQSSAMVAGHNTLSMMGISPTPEGSLAEQFLHAEATNIQLAAGMSLLHAAAPGLPALERSMDLSLRSREGTQSFRSSGEGVLSNPLALASAGGRGLDITRFRPESLERPSGHPEILLSEIHGDPASSGFRKAKPSDWPANISDAWSQLEGSSLYTSQEVKDTEALPRVIAGEDGLLRLLNGRPEAITSTEEGSSQPRRNKNAVHSIWGYGSFPHFRDGKVEDIRRWDADKKPDFIIVGEMRDMLDNLADLWGLSEAQRRELQDHGVYEPQGPREGFVYFNTDMLIPGRGPVSFKISIVDTRAFFALHEGKPALEYSQIRLKDATPENLLWSRGQEEKAQSLSHLEIIRDEMFEQAYRHIGGRLLSLWNPLNLFRYRTNGNSLVRSFFTMSFRLEWYRFWENLWGPFDKGKKLFQERREEVRPLLLRPLQRFASRHADTITLQFKNKVISPHEITPENMYDVIFTDRGFSRGALGRFRTFWKDFPAYISLNKRGYRSYRQHGLPSNLFSHAYYVQPPAEYAGRKARGIVEKSGRFGLFLNWLLSTDRAKRMRITRQISLDSRFSPVYYSQIAPYINDLYAGGRNEKDRAKFPQALRLTDGEYDALMGWFVSNPRLSGLKNNEILGLLNAFRISADSNGQSGATKLFRWIEGRPRLEPEVAEYIRSLRLDEPPPPPPPPALAPSSSSSRISSAITSEPPEEESPWEIKQMVEVYLPAINLLSVGSSPRMFDLLRQTIRLSLADNPPRAAFLIDYVNRSERGEDTMLRRQVDIHNSVANPDFINEPVPEPRAIVLQPPARVVTGIIHAREREHDELADTLSPEDAELEKKNQP
jgi:hypothetical protein